MAGPRRATRSTRNQATPEEVETRVPRDIYAEMLTEAGVKTGADSEPPLKRRRARRPGDGEPAIDGSAAHRDGVVTTGNQSVDSGDEEEGIEFEDVEIPRPTIQTMEMESDEEDSDDEDEGAVFEDVDFNVPVSDENTPEASEVKGKSMELNLTAQKAAMAPANRRASKKKPLTREEKERRVEVHKTHLLSLLFHCAMRNRWCNDDKVQRCLKALLSQQMINYLNPSRKLSQFGRAEALKKGLQEVGNMFRLKYQITERGLRRALWADDVEDLGKHEPPPDLETCMDKADFLRAARTLQGSRDVGAQLYCALLRAAGVQARLVCSLQPLSFLAGGPTLPVPRELNPRARKPTMAGIGSEAKKHDIPESNSPSAPATSTRRHAAFPTTPFHYRRSAPTTPQSSKRSPVSRQIKESAFPVYWVEVLDVAHQKWQPADPLVTKSCCKTRVFEPPLTDRENSMAYVVAFGADGAVRDVTQRYTKAYTAKTRRLRVESAEGRGDEWWRRRALGRYALRGPRTDLEQIEDHELAAALAREPIPRNIADFRAHPLYVLGRHLRRNEVLSPGAKDVGTVAAGPRAPVERVYLRRSVGVARSREKWYRMGREVRFNEIPVKWLPPRRIPRGGGRYEDEGEDEGRGSGGGGLGEAGTPLFLEDQTEVFRHPPVVDGVVPRNKFGNLDVYVPSMVPSGGAHVDDEMAARAAFVLGVNYVPALTGFRFKGRHGTAVLRGAVVPAEAEEGVRSVVQGLRDLETEMEGERRRRACLAMWRKMLMGLRIREMIWAGVDEEAEAAAGGVGEEREREMEEDFDRAVADAASDVSEEFAMEEDYGYGGGGGFLV